ncbi:trypco2 family protein [Streptomyces olivochromogenes]|nr:trypco2 family protein [Streptomyces olivochromogenes]
MSYSRLQPRGQDLAFKVGPVELELAMEFRAAAKAKAGFKA